MAQRIPQLYIADSDLAGRGVFTAIDIPAGSIIEVCPVIIVPEKEAQLIQETILYDYYFIWGDTEKEIAIALGYGSLYNHSFEPNAFFESDFESTIITIICKKDIVSGDEILVNYNGDDEPDEALKKKLWFKVKS